MAIKFSSRFFIIIYLVCSLQVKASNNSLDRSHDSLASNTNTIVPKKGYNLAPFPEFMIDPVVGLYVGINATLFDFGDGSKYPNYDQLFNLNAAWGTKGKTNFSLKYKKYGKQIFSAKLSYSKANLYPFYGLNGYQTYYNEAYENYKSLDYITSAFYKYKQEKTQFGFSLQDKVKNTSFHWLLGLNVGYYVMGRVDFNKLNKNVEGVDVIVDAPTLYDKYIDWQLINKSDKDGGWANSIQSAVLYDTRDRLTNPLKGIWSQATLRITPNFLGNDATAIQIGVKHHQFITLIQDKLSLACRMRYDATFGDLPIYSRQVLADGIEGYGGASGMIGEGFGTIWGVNQNRVVGKQMALGNLELRAKLFHYYFLNQNWQISLVPIFHTGVILEPYPLDLSLVSVNDEQAFFRSSYKGWYSSIGLGGKLVINENIVMGIDWAHALNSEAGDNAIYVGLGYTF